RRRHTRSKRDWSSDVCSSDLSLVLDRVAGISFDAGVFTNLTQDHLDFHGDMRSYAEAKAKLMGMCRYAVVNLDDEWSQFMLRHEIGRASGRASAEKGEGTGEV